MGNFSERSSRGLGGGRHARSAGRDAEGGSAGRDAPGGLRRGRIMAWRPPAAWLARVRDWSPAVGLFGRGIRVLAVRLAMVILLTSLSVLAVPIAVTTLTSAVPPPPAGWTTAFSHNFSGSAASGTGRRSGCWAPATGAAGPARPGP